jgi:hypothetical protein
MNPRYVSLQHVTSRWYGAYFHIAMKSPFWEVWWGPIEDGPVTYILHSHLEICFIRISASYSSLMVISLGNLSAFQYTNSRYLP